jgi:hypothetical protein
MYLLLINGVPSVFFKIRNGVPCIRETDEVTATVRDVVCSSRQWSCKGDDTLLSSVQLVAAETYNEAYNIIGNYPNILILQG